VIAARLLERAAPARLRIRRLALSVSALATPRRQLNLFAPSTFGSLEAPAFGALQEALDDLRRTHGMTAIRRGCVLAAPRASGVGP